ncbi:hypothetical protein M2650_00195 [Luteimonas sp. SX5]|uniref:AsmA family protein n=1 Tax=Luteimonas galliterrae TaxID=2940486 RepID=A0ABT0MFF1_9GAMM|nr:hypothetical protein [Luteimonas galliterrae]MCL1633070.1 hypothetical protein [Luteimonas galliterrae]
MKITGRTWLIAAMSVVLLSLLALRWFAQPDRVASLLLARAGAALGLEITASGASEYRLLGTPMLVVRDVVAKQPGAATPLLRAKRIYLTLPWSTIRAGGADLIVERIELDAPQLDLPALLRWLATRPPGETKIPTLTDGLQVDDGRVTGDGWSIESLDLQLPALYPQRRVHAHASGRVLAGGTRLPFDVHAVLIKPEIGAGLGLAGQLSVESSDWKLPMKPILGGRLHSDADGLGLDRMKLGATARYVSGDTDLPFAFGLAGPLRYRGGVLAIAPIGSVVHGDDPVPELDAHGRIAYGNALSLQLAGKIAAWPSSWPALPAPIGASPSPLPFSLNYAGKPDFSDIAALSLQRDQTHFDGRFRLPEVTAWIDAGAAGSPLPPLDGRIVTPALEVSGAQLRGVEIEMDDPAIAEPPVR